MSNSAAELYIPAHSERKGKNSQKHPSTIDDQLRWSYMFQWIQIENEKTEKNPSNHR
jgi:hypothetical protein